MPLKKRIKVDPETDLGRLRDHLAKLSGRQMTEVLKHFLKESNVKITPSSEASENISQFRIGVVAGMFLAIGICKNKESALTHPDPAIRLFAKALLEDEIDSVEPRDTNANDNFNQQNSDGSSSADSQSAQQQDSAR